MCGYVLVYGDGGWRVGVQICVYVRWWGGTVGVWVCLGVSWWGLENRCEDMCVYTVVGVEESLCQYVELCVCVCVCMGE